MVPVGGKLWCGSQNRVLIINTTTLEKEVGGTCRGLGVESSAGVKTPPSPSALVPGGHRQQSLRHLYGGLRSGGVVGTAGQRTGPAVPCSELGKPDGSRRGACRAQDARR